MKLIWTRSLEDWNVDRPLLVDIESKLLRLPCLKIVALPVTLPAGSPTHLVFTSQNAVRYAEPAIASLLPEVVCFTHGELTEQLLQSRGARTVRPDVKSASELAEAVKDHLKSADSQQPHVWVPAAEDPAFDIAQDLRRAGITAEKIPCYRTIRQVQTMSGPVTPANRQALAAQLKGVVAFASPSAVEAFQQAFGTEGQDRPEGLVAICIGPTTRAAAGPYFRLIKESSHSNLDSLAQLAIATLEDIS